MKSIKFLISFILVLIMSMVMVSCSDDGSTNTSNKRVYAVSSNSSTSSSTKSISTKSTSDKITYRTEFNDSGTISCIYISEISSTYENKFVYTYDANDNMTKWEFYQAGTDGTLILNTHDYYTYNDDQQLTYREGYIYTTFDDNDDGERDTAHYVLATKSYYTYNDNGNVTFISQKSANLDYLSPYDEDEVYVYTENATTAFTYTDGLCTKVIKTEGITTTSAGISETVYYTYDSSDRLLTIINPSNTKTYIYSIIDEIDLLVGISTVSGDTTTTLTLEISTEEGDGDNDWYSKFQNLQNPHVLIPKYVAE